MASHKSKVFVTWITIAIALGIYVTSFFYTGISGYATIGTSVQITGPELFPPGGGGSGGGAFGSQQNFSMCLNKVVLSKDRATVVDTEKFRNICITTSDLLPMQSYFARIVSNTVNLILQIEITLYPSYIGKTYLPNIKESIVLDLDNSTRIYIKRLSTIAKYNFSNVDIFENTYSNNTIGGIVMSLNENYTLPQIAGIVTLADLLNTTDVTQKIQLVELDENGTILNDSSIILLDLKKYKFNGQTKRIAIQFNPKDNWYIFSRNNLSNEFGENSSLQDFSEQFLLETENAFIVPAQLFLFRTVLLVVVSLGFLTLHNISLQKKYPRHNISY